MTFPAGAPFSAADLGEDGSEPANAPAMTFILARLTNLLRSIRRLLSKFRSGRETSIK
jgi:hypothetical protein